MKIKIKIPLKELVVIHQNHQLLKDISLFEDLLVRELNVLKVRYEINESHFIELIAKPNYPLLGQKLGKRMK